MGACPSRQAAQAHHMTDRADVCSRPERSTLPKRLRLLVAVLLCVAVLLPGQAVWANSTQTDDPPPPPADPDQPLRLIVAGTEIVPDVPPQIVNGRTLVPVRVVSEALGARVYWNEHTREVTIRDGDDLTQIRVGETRAWVNNRSYTLDVPAHIVDGRTLVPLRFIAETMGYKVDWDPYERTVSVGPFTLEAMTVAVVDGVPTVRLKADGPLLYKRLENGNARDIILELPHTERGGDVPDVLRAAVPFLQDVTVTDGARPGSLQVTVRQSSELEPYITYADNTIVIGLRADIVGVVISEYAGQTRVAVSSSFPLQWVYEFQPESNRILLDFPNSRLRLQQTVFPGSGFVDRIVPGPAPLAGWSRLTVHLKTPDVSVERAEAVTPNAAIIDIGPGNGEMPTGNGKVVFLDPGHGGRDPGAIGLDGTPEKELNLKISLLLRDELVKRGYRVIMSRETDVTVDLYDRPEMANASGADIFVSIHNNAYYQREHGTEIYWYNSNPGSPKLARAVQRAMREGIGLFDRGVKNHESFVVIKYTTMPAILVEIAFVTNPEEIKLLVDPEFQLRAARAIARGIDLYFASE